MIYEDSDFFLFSVKTHISLAQVRALWLAMYVNVSIYVRYKIKIQHCYCI